MENIHIYSKRTNTILEDRKSFLHKKLQERRDKNQDISYIAAEYNALDEIINFMQWIGDNMSDETVEELINKYKKSFSENPDEADEELPEDDIISVNKTLFAGEVKSTQNSKVAYSFIERDGKRFILLKGKKLSGERTSWKTEGEFLFTRTTLEKIFNRYRKVIKEENAAAITT